jgi:SDR family mycofactocin-dependent oxidoreductase
MRGADVGRVDGKVALITGAARGQGRAHAVRLAEEGADIVAIDICRDIETVPYPGATEADLARTAELVEGEGRRVVTAIADVRDLSALQQAAERGAEILGGIDVVVANAGIGSFGSAIEIDETTWQTTLDVNLTGAWKTVKATTPIMLRQRHGGSIIVVSSLAATMAYPHLAHYVSSKHALTGLMRCLAMELAPQGIRVNTVNPGTVDTPMVSNPVSWKGFTGQDVHNKDDAARLLLGGNALPVPWVEPRDVSNAIVYLASDESRYVTGTMNIIDAGAGLPIKMPHVGS